MAQRILIVDDDPKIVRLLRASLEQTGYQVLVAYDGETALTLNQPLPVVSHTRRVFSRPRLALIGQNAEFLPPTAHWANRRR